MAEGTTMRDCAAALPPHARRLAATGLGTRGALPPVSHPVGNRAPRHRSPLAVLAPGPPQRPDRAPSAAR